MITLLFCCVSASAAPQTFVQSEVAGFQFSTCDDQHKCLVIDAAKASGSFLRDIFSLEGASVSIKSKDTTLYSYLDVKAAYIDFQLGHLIFTTEKGEQIFTFARSDSWVAAK